MAQRPPFLSECSCCPLGGVPAVSRLWWDRAVVSSCSPLPATRQIMRDGTLAVWLRHHFPDHVFSLRPAPCEPGGSSGDQGYLISSRQVGRQVNYASGRRQQSCITLISGWGRGSCRHHPVLPFLLPLVLVLLLLHSCSQFMCNDLGPSCRNQSHSSSSALIRSDLTIPHLHRLTGHLHGVLLMHSLFPARLPRPHH